MYCLSRSLRGFAWIGMGVLLSACSLLVSLDDLSETDAEESRSGDGGPSSESDAPIDASGGSLLDSQSDADADADVTAYRNAVLAAGPIAYWRLDEISGTQARDEVQNKHPGLYYGGYTLGEPGLPSGGHSVRLNGTSGCIGVGSYFRFPGNVPFSVEAWIKVSTLPGFSRVVSTEGAQTGTRNGFSLLVDNGYPVLEGWLHDGTDNQFVLGAYANAANGGMIELGEWNHLVGTFEADAEEIWVNGVLRNRQNQSNLALKDVGTFTIGCAGTGSGQVFTAVDGWLTEVAIYDKVLTEVQIAAHHAAGSKR